MKQIKQIPNALAYLRQRALAWAPAVAMAAALSLAQAAPARAASLTVTNTNDSGPGSLRQLIADAASGDTIDFNIPASDPGCASGVCTITLTSGELAIGKDLTISGPGANALTISGNNASRIFFINPGTPGATTGPPATNPVVSIANLTIANGLAKGGNGGNGSDSNGCKSSGGGGGAAGMGGGLLINGGAVTVANVIFDHNQAIGGKGGDACAAGIVGAGGGGVGSDPVAGNGGNGGNFGGLGGIGFLGPFDGGDGAGGGFRTTGGGIRRAGHGGFGGGGGAGSFSTTSNNNGHGGLGGFGGGGGGGGGLAHEPGGVFGGASGFGGGASHLTAASGGGGGALGGALFIRAGSLSLTGSSFTNNSATQGLGGINLQYPGFDDAAPGQGKAGAIFICTVALDPTCSGTVSAVDNTFSGNTANNAGSTPFDNSNVYGGPGSCDSAVTITPSTLPTGQVGVPYNQTLSASGSGGSFSWSGGALPFGFTLDGNGTLSGTLLSGGSFTFSVFATSNGFSGGCQSVTLNIAGTPPQLPAGATSWWQAESNANDAIGPNHGTPNGSATFAAGQVNQAFRFDGTNGYVALPDNLFPFPTTGTGNTPFSFELWFKTAGNGVILGQQNSVPYGTANASVPAIYVGTDGKLRVEMFWNGTFPFNPLTSGAPVNDGGAFHHVAVVYDGATEAVYLDSELMGSRAHTQTGYAAYYYYQLGTGRTVEWPASNGGWFNFTGLIDEPTLYNRALSAAEVQAIFRAGNAGKVIDTIAPTASPSQSPAANANGWNNSDVTVAWNWTDNAGGVGIDPANCTTSSVSSGEGTLALTATCKDLAGNEGSASYTVKVDKTTPTISADGTPYTAPDWTNQNIVVHFTCSDAGSGIADCPADQTISAEGTLPAVQGTATDNAGNSADAFAGPFQIDQTKPVISGSRTPAANAAGWNNSDVTVSFTCADNANGSTIGSDTVAGATVSSEGNNHSVTNTGTCVDVAGNVADAATVSGISIDKSKPTISAATTSTPNAAGWHSSNVTVHFTCADSLSGVPACAADQVLSAEGAAVVSTAQTVSDAAGNASDPSNVVTVKIDKTAPTVAVTGVSNGGSYTLGSVPAAACTSSDALSGVATQATLSVTGGNPDGSGSFIATCNGATDSAGNSAAPVSVSYTVTVPVDVCTTSGLLDTFNRANGGLGSNWAGLTNQSFYKIANNKVDVQVGGAVIWKPTSFGTSQSAFVTLSTIDSASPSQGVLLKVQTGSIPNAGAISVVYDALAHAVRVSALRLNNPTWTLYANTPATFANGDKLGGCALADGTVRIYKNNAKIATVTLDAADKSFFTGKGGKVGLWTLAAPNAFLDDFGGGSVTP